MKRPRDIYEALGWLWDGTLLWLAMVSITVWCVLIVWQP